jgi:GT2 family glycosyltransferase
MKLGILILHYNTPELTRKLCKAIPEAIVFDNGSEKSYTGPNRYFRFDENYGFTKGWNEAIKKVYHEFDAFWLMNSDIMISRVSIDRIKCLLESHEDVGMITPAYNCWMKHCQKQNGSNVREIPILEFTAPVIRKRVIEECGYFDERFVRGYGIEFDYCYRMRQLGMKMYVDDGSSFHHIGHQTINVSGGLLAYSEKANFELNQGLSEKYGIAWRDNILKGVSIKSDFSMNIAVYVTIFGDYDNLKAWPTQNVRADYFIITDNPKLKVEGWKTIVPEFPRRDLHPRMRAKYFKLFPWEALPTYEMSIYIDASIQVKSNHFVEFCIRNLTGDMVLFRHPDRACIYKEAAASISLKKYQAEPVMKQVEYYKTFHPVNAGLYACGVMVRKHTPIVHKVMHDWWFENVKWSYQDQLSFPVVCRLNDFTPAVFEENQYSNEFFEVKWHDDTDQKTDITVLMPVYNTPVDIFKIAVQSILNQKYTSFELLIIDDNNKSPQLVEYLRQLPNTDKRIRVIRTSENKGLAAALDFGLKEAKADLIVRMDSDDIADDRLLKLHHEFFTLYKDRHICGVQVEVMANKPWKSPHSPVVNKILAQRNKGYWFVNHPGVAYRKHAVLSVGGYGDVPSKFPEDYALWCKMLAAGYLIYNRPETLVKYRVYEDREKTKLHRDPEYYEFLENCKKLLV